MSGPAPWARTAEDMLAEFRAALIEKMEAGVVLEALYGRASEKHQVMMMGRLDEAREAERLVGALAAARRYLAAQKPSPQPDPTPRKRG